MKFASKTLLQVSFYFSSGIERITDPFLPPDPFEHHPHDDAFSRQKSPYALEISHSNSALSVFNFFLHAFYLLMRITHQLS
jgi:hypothetical protein